MKQHPSLTPHAPKSVWAPDFIAPNIGAVDFTWLEGQGIKACLIDLDDTLFVRGAMDVDAATRKILAGQPLPIFIATNRPISRDLKALVVQINAAGIIQPEGLRGKPTKHYFARAAKLTGHEPSEVVMIGDHILQDVIGANRAGLRSLAVGKFGPVIFPYSLIARFDTFVLARLSRHYDTIS